MPEATEDPLEGAARFMWAGAVCIRNDKGQEVQPIGFSLTDNSLAILPLNLVPYDHWRDALCAMALGGADVVGHVCEAWAVKTTPETEAAYDAARALGVRNEDRDDRVEILQVVAEDAGGRIFALRSEIKDGRAGEPEPLGTDEQLGDRLTGLFPPLERSGL